MTLSQFKQQLLDHLSVLDPSVEFRQKLHAQLDQDPVDTLLRQWCGLPASALELEQITPAMATPAVAGELTFDHIEPGQLAQAIDTPPDAVAQSNPLPESNMSTAAPDQPAPMDPQPPEAVGVPPVSADTAPSAHTTPEKAVEEAVDSPPSAAEAGTVLDPATPVEDIPVLIDIASTSVDPVGSAADTATGVPSGAAEGTAAPAPASLAELTTGCDHPATGAPQPAVPPADSALQQVVQKPRLGLPRTPPVLRLNNARCGQPFRQVLEARDDAGLPVAIQQVSFSPALALEFDAQTQTLHGTPQHAGEFMASVFWAPERPPLQVPLLVNPDPRSLWQVREPDPTLPFKKPHTACARIAGSGFELLAAGRRGRSHEHGGTFRDDDQYIHHDDQSGFGLLIVADGAGSAEFSREGSRLAVQQVAQSLTAQLHSEAGQAIEARVLHWDKTSSEQNQQLSQFFYQAFQQALHDAVRALEAAADHFGKQVRQYATTLLASVYRVIPGPQGDRLFVASCWIGDGAIAVYGLPGPEPVKLLGSPDGGEYAGQTRFLDRAILASADFSKRVSLGLFEQPQALLLMTDGVSDPYFDTEQQMRDPARWQRLWQDLQAPLAEPAPEAALLDWLNFWSPGNHDDRTLALWRTRPGVAGGALATGPSAAGAEPAADFSYSGLSS